MNDASELINYVRSGTATLPETSVRVDRLNTTDFLQLMDWLSELAALPDSMDDAMWSIVLASISHRKKFSEVPLQLDESARIHALYNHLGAHRDQRYHLLTRLTKHPNRDNLELFSELMITNPPRSIASVSAPFVPLFQQGHEFDVNAVFPKLLDGLSNPYLASPVLDFANFLVRSGRLDTHPAFERVEQLLRFVEAVVANLSELQATATASTDDLKQKQHAVANSLPLAVALCDALALIGDDRAIPSLTRLAELKHRRLRVEAAAAIIRLENQRDPNAIVQPLKPQRSEGQDQPTEAVLLLAKMAAEPVVRLRAVAYAEELGVVEQIAFEHRSPIALAVAELTAFLAEPIQMGMPPATCELVDSRVLYWPGYEEPRNCYLFRFTYQIATDPDNPPTTYESLGIAGPLVHAFHADLSTQSTEYIYAAFAGYQAEHEEIREVDLTSSYLRSHQQDIVDSLSQRLARFGYHDMQPQIFGHFFGESVLVASAMNDQSVRGIVVVDEVGREDWYHHSQSHRAIGPVEAWYIYKGSRLLRSFNSEDFDV